MKNIIFILIICFCSCGKKVNPSDCINNTSNSSNGSEVTSCHIQKVKIFTPLLKDTINSMYLYNQESTHLCTCYPLLLENKDSIFYHNHYGSTSDFSDSFSIMREKKRYNFTINSHSTKKIFDEFSNTSLSFQDTLGYKIIIESYLYQFKGVNIRVHSL